MLKLIQKIVDIQEMKMYSKGVKKKGSERNMKKATSLLIVLVLTVGAIQALPGQAKKLNSMIKHTSIVSVNDNNCSGMETIKNLYYHDKALQNHYDNNDIKVYVYHELDNDGFSHDEIEINFTHCSFRYDF